MQASSPHCLWPTDNAGKTRKEWRIDPESGADKEGHDNPVVDPKGEQQTEATPQRNGNGKPPTDTPV